MLTDQKEISIIVSTRDRGEVFYETLKHIVKAVDGFNAEIIIVNDSKINQILLPADLYNIKVLNNPLNGVASARNLGAANANSSLLWFLDDDMLIHQTMVQEAIKVNKENPNAIYNFNWEYPPELLLQIRKTPFGRFLEKIEFTTMKGWCRNADWKENSIFNTKSLAGATLLIPADLYARVGGYNSSFPLAGFEDHDFSVRIVNLGIPCFIDTRVTAWHNEVNKTSLKGFLVRTYNNAITRRHAVQIGYADQKIVYSPLKKFVYLILGILQPILILVLDHWPETIKLDTVYFRLCHALIGLNIYRGYSNI